ncbi:S9 family peptidase [Halobacteriovorax sp. HLS]|uniref:S9 family peptidase n=1 Tax=Halobacteriovorax sp. HLS TaxID=2234000 RepID=UPI000FDADF4A|nr:S9 family peptidase [Halobacteriovorax sp. HLS]
MKIPSPKKIPHKMIAHEDERVDNYYWMRFLDEDKDVKKHLLQENDFFKDYLQNTTELQKQLYDEMRSRKKEKDQSVPALDGDYYYYDRYEEGQEYAIHCRTSKGSNSEEILLDVNLLAIDKDFVDIGAFSVSPDGKKMAYSIDDNGSEVYKIYIKNLETGDLYPEIIDQAYDSICWFNDSEHFCYNVVNKNLRPHKIKKHKLHSDVSSDEVLYHDKSAEFFVHCAKGIDNEYIFAVSGGSVSTEYSILSANKPEGKFNLFQKRKDDLEYDIDHRDGIFYILTNDEHENFRVVTCDSKDSSLENWKEFIPGSDSRYLLGFDTYNDFAVLTFREDGLRNYEIIFFDERPSQLITFPAQAYSTSVGENYEFNTSVFRYNYSALNCPSSVLEYDVNTKTTSTLKVLEVANFDSDKYIVRRRSYTSRDGVKVPVSILCLKDYSENSPLYVYGYGSYGSTIDPSFRDDLFSLVDRGFNFAIIHPRGSSTLGRSWYENGKFLEKKNTFNDFIDATRGLCEDGYGKEGNIIASGGSAGGLLMGAIANLAPDLYKTIVAEVPFVDVLTTMLDKDLPLTQLEYKEWGNPQEREYYDYIKSYSPYDNLEAKNYPNILATAGLNDPRVTYWEPAKWIAKLRDLNTGSSSIFLYTNMDAGHGGASGRFEYLKEESMVYAYILKSFGRD